MGAAALHRPRLGFGSLPVLVYRQESPYSTAVLRGRMLGLGPSLGDASSSS